SSSTYDSLTPEEFYYVNWNNYSNGLLTGTVNVGGTIVNVSVTNSSNSIIQYGDAPYCGTSHWAPAPSGNGGSGSFRSYTLGQHRFMFDQPVSNPRFFISSLNKVLNLSAPGKILASNGDFVGAPDGTVTTVLNGDEACGTVSFAGDFTEVSFTGLETEFYCDFSMGIAGLSIPCVNSVLPTIIHETTNATGIGTPSGLPAGVTATWANNTITISGTPTQSGTFNYDIPLTGGCGTVSATGTITVLAYPNISYPQTDYTLYSGNAISSISPSNTGGTITSWSISPALPAGLTLNTSSGVISGTPTDGFNETTFTITASNGHCEDTTSLTLNALTCYNFNSNDVILRGNATVSGNEITLTPASNTQFGAVWSTDRLDLTKDFRVKSQLYFGNNNAGADGLAFVLQPLSSNQGSSGGGLGYAGINPSFSVEFDTYYNGAHELSNDHMAIIKNGLATGNHSEFAPMIDLGNIEDNNWHDFEVSWIAATKNFKVYYDGSLRYNQTIDIVNNIFSGNQNAYFGFTAATGGSVNTHAVRLIESCLTRILNIPPTVTSINDFNSCFNQTTSAQSFTISDDTTPVANMTVTATSSNTSLVPNNQITITGTGATKDITVTPVSGQFGTTTITVVVEDQEGLSVSESFTVTIDDTVVPTVVTQNVTIQLDSNGNANITTGMINNGSSDNCDIDTITLDTTSFNCSNVGNNTVTLTVTDVKGNSSSNTAVVTVEDNINPTVLFTQNITIQLNASGTASISTSDIDNGSFDNCGIASMTLSQVNFDCSHLGNNTVVFTVVDNNGNTVTQNVTVTVLDNINPVAIGQNITVSLNADGQFILDPALIDNGSYDNCDYTLTASPNIFGPANIGVNNVILVITDSSGNSHYTVVQVTITDNVNPVVNTQNITINLDSNGLASITANQVNNGSTDNAQIASMSVSPDSFTCDDLGANTVTLTVTDTSGNNNTGTATVTVVDNINPTITAPAAVTTTTNTACTATGVTLGTPVTADNCSVASVTNDAPASFPIGNTTVTWTVTDGSGNTATATQLVKVTDSTVPTITAPAAVTVPTNNGCFAVNVVLGTPVTADNCSIASVTNDAPATFPIGTTTVTWTVTDTAGNTATATQVITVIDTQLPTIVAPIAINTTTNTDCTRTGLVLGNAVTTDNCSVVSVTNDAPAAFPLGTTTVTWTVVDGSGNTATATQVVTVTDVTLPTITAPAAVNVTTNTACTATGVTLGTPVTADNCSVASVTNNAPATFPLGTTTVTWTVVDGSGNTATATQVVTVTDVTVPTITAPSNVVWPSNIGCYAVNVLLGSPSVADNCSIASISNNAPFVFPLGTTTVTWTVVDGSGNTATATQTVTIVDIVAPALMAPVAINTITNSSCTATGVILGNPIANDNCSSVTVTNNAPVAFPLGNTTVTWTAVDASGNTTTATQLVTVRDVELPTITAPAAVNVNTNTACTATGVTLGTPVTADNCSVASVTNNAPAAFPLGTTTVTWTIVDGSGNTATATQIVTVTDVTVPTITAPAAVTVSTNNGCFAVNVALGTPVTADNCSIASVTNDAPATFPLGATTVTWTIVDGSGNTATATQVVTIVDTQLPSIIAPIAINTTTNTDCTRTGLVLGNAITTDNCSVASVTNDAPAAFPLGTTTVTWTVVDGSGNTATATQIVTVTDVTLPTITAPAAVNVTTNTACTATGVTLGTPVTADNCSVASVTNNAPATFPLGTTTVTWTVVDGSGNTATATQIVTVTDVTVPTITAPAAVTVPTNNGCFAVNVALGTPVTADNCSIASVTNNAPATFPLGTTTVTWTIVDGSGNTATATQVITVIDTQLPTIVAPIAINTTTNTDCTRTGLVLGNAITTDNCSVASVTN
ncbi:MAG: HYR domain-containing protein, partial [Flavobacteriaceae bacterium]